MSDNNLVIWGLIWGLSPNYPNYIPILLMYVLLVPAVAFYIKIKRKGTGRDDPAVIIKGLCTALVLTAAVIGLPCTGGENLAYTTLIILGLALGLAGDIAICSNFLSGMVFFAIGHLCYIPAFLIKTENPVWAVPVFALLYTFTVILYRKSRIKPGRLLIPAIVYSIIISIMLSMAVSILISTPKEPASIIIFTGALLFTISDILLARNVFSRVSSKPRRSVANKLGGISTYCYFIGQSLFAVSVYFI